MSNIFIKVFKHEICLQSSLRRRYISWLLEWIQVPQTKYTFWYQYKNRIQYTLFIKCVLHETTHQSMHTFRNWRPRLLKLIQEPVRRPTRNSWYRNITTNDNTANFAKVWWYKNTKCQILCIKPRLSCNLMIDKSNRLVFTCWESKQYSRHCCGYSSLIGGSWSTTGAGSWICFKSRLLKQIQVL